MGADGSLDGRVEKLEERMTVAELRIDGVISRLDSMSARVIDVQRDLEGGFAQSRAWQIAMAKRMEQLAADAAASREENGQQHDGITDILQEMKATMREFIRAAEAVVRT